MFNVTSHEGNTDQRHSKHHLTPIRMAISRKGKKKKKNKTIASEVAQKMEPLYTDAGNANK